jgi:predicted 2-oxoglutarate/Fe(II)-dependent dioxygenase YbiX/peroxiredoxin
MTDKQIMLGDPAPWFDAETLAGTTHNLGVLAGRWVALFFVPSLSDPVATRALGDLITKLGRFFNDDHVVCFIVLGEAPPVVEPFVQASHRGLGFITDYDGKISGQYGARGALRMILLDPFLRAYQIFTVGEAGASPEEICACLGNLPAIDDQAGVPMLAPALIIPRVFEPEFCDQLIDLYNQDGGKDSGFMLDKGGKTMTVIDHKLKQRRDRVLDDALIREQIRDRVVRRVVPMMERFFQYRPTRMDRYLVSCYDAGTGGHFARHRDNINVGARHRRFAASFNLNHDYDGCDLIFPEFGRRLYRAPEGGAIVFSTGALHQVTPVTRGKRYAFVPFFYGEEEARQRKHNNANLHEGEGLYTGEQDWLFPATTD